MLLLLDDGCSVSQSENGTSLHINSLKINSWPWRLAHNLLETGCEFTEDLVKLIVYHYMTTVRLGQFWSSSRRYVATGYNANKEHSYIDITYATCDWSNGQCRPLGIVISLKRRHHPTNSRGVPNKHAFGPPHNDLSY